jgi:DNA-binding transcriptional MerR regulator
MVSIGKVSEMIGVPAYTIRYWEKMFDDFLQPPRTQGSHRKYREFDIKLLMKIRRMLKDEKYSIAGARQKLQQSLLSEEGEESVLINKNILDGTMQYRNELRLS